MQKKKRFRLFLLLAFAISLIQLFSILSTYCSTGHESFNNHLVKKYEEVMIHRGDSLWKLAQKYKPEDKSTKEYVKLIKEFNRLESDRLYAGDTIIIPIY
ncbi:MAG TPA: LysM peptidoglycan-binding domain-containing protein [Defluviitaleaceae bacterium]|nr:LysM peptidoglycan-binding domain-containing protein [Candidatus Epulonipiscium sp.]HOQ16233.1 LysM peptidoglycan-binding domain-containing protein [Defluviitaleaceae bacterium]HPT75310.1 LysM peptidoglycan-binding domain-containing protein [Defluviitaleaceae bacterium]HQD51016.1 LysM peptidoglycan-binding domain-containing protein [Defluviitaleaceae bacterium]